jgi:hypothetical protein
VLLGKFKKEKTYKSGGEGNDQKNVEVDHGGHIG